MLYLSRARSSVSPAPLDAFVGVVRCAFVMVLHQVARLRRELEQTQVINSQVTAQNSSLRDRYIKLRKHAVRTILRQQALVKGAATKLRAMKSEYNKVRIGVYRSVRGGVGMRRASASNGCGSFGRVRARRCYCRCSDTL